MAASGLIDCAFWAYLVASNLGGSGSIEIPRSYFGRGLCVIVYANTSLSRALATRAI
jgi:hypothetical protein